MGPLFGAVLARAIDAEWRRCRRPDPWVVVEVGAADGALAAAVLGAEPACAGALRYVCVEASGARREAAAERLPVEVPSLVLGPRPPPAEPGGPEGVPRRGPLVTVLADLPAEPFTGMIVANELLDNLVIDLLAWDGRIWSEVLVGETAGRPAEVLVPAAEEDAALAARLVGGAALAGGARIPLQRAAAKWLATALMLVARGRVLCVDYCSETTAALAGRPLHEWLRTYRAHGLGGHPLDHPGQQDITCEVAIDQLTRVRPPSADRSQAEWLDAHGLAELTASARADWESATTHDLDALKARSRVSEGAALRDPAGLGAFRVLEWER